MRKVERLPRGIVEGGGCGVGDVAGMVFPTKVDAQLFASGNKGWHEGGKKHHAKDEVFDHRALGNC